MSVERDPEKMFLGVSFIGSKRIVRAINSPNDYRPLCFHYHESEEEAKTCKLALEHYLAGTLPPFPVDEPKKGKRAAREEASDESIA